MAAKATKAGKAASAPKAASASEADSAPKAGPAGPRAEDADEQPAKASGSAEEPTSAEEFVPMNRAERRAKARGKSTVPPPSGRGKVGGSHGPAHTFRNWANRRTG